MSNPTLTAACLYSCVFAETDGGQHDDGSYDHGVLAAGRRVVAGFPVSDPSHPKHLAGPVSRGPEKHVPGVWQRSIRILVGGLAPGRGREAVAQAAASRGRARSVADHVAVHQDHAVRPAVRAPGRRRRRDGAAAGASAVRRVQHVGRSARPGRRTPVDADAAIEKTSSTTRSRRGRCRRPPLPRESVRTFEFGNYSRPLKKKKMNVHEIRLQK